MIDNNKIISSGIIVLALGLIWLGISMTNPQASSILMFATIGIGLFLVVVGVGEARTKGSAPGKFLN